MKNTAIIKDETKVWLLSEIGRCATWQQWLKFGGCRLSGNSSSNVSKAFSRSEKHWTHLTLGEIQSSCIVAGRELAGFAVRHLDMPEMAVLEYDFAVSKNSLLPVS